MLCIIHHSCGCKPALSGSDPYGMGARQLPQPLPMSSCLLFVLWMLLSSQQIFQLPVEEVSGNSEFIHPQKLL